MIYRSPRPQIDFLDLSYLDFELPKAAEFSDRAA